MKLIEKIIDGEGQIQIPDCTRDELPGLFKDMGFNVGAEIGVYKGEFSEKLCKAGLKMYGIDPWDESKRHEGYYQEAKKLLEPYDYTIIRKTSMDALKDFEDESLDFVYIDANHSFKYALDDIYGWSFKIRKGGIISGHDYALNRKIGVKHAVNIYTLVYGINPWYVLGTMRYVAGEKRDKWRSWLWKKA